MNITTVMASDKPSMTLVSKASGSNWVTYFETVCDSFVVRVTGLSHPLHGHHFALVSQRRP